jgi:hypothetical protein
MAETVYKDVEVPSRFTKFNTPGQSVAGTIVALDPKGKFGTEVSLKLDSGDETVISCSSARLAEWAQVIAVGQKWKVTFVGQSAGKEGQQGAKQFRFAMAPTKAAPPRRTEPVRDEPREPGEDDDVGDGGGEASPFLEERP